MVNVVTSGYLHVGTNCRVVLPGRLDGKDFVRGRIVMCRHVRGILHAATIEFLDPVFPRLYVELSECDQLTAETDIQAWQLQGTVLVVDDMEIDRMLVSHFLAETRFRVTSVSTSGEALSAAAQVRYDAMLLDLFLGPKDRGDELIPKFRQVGFGGPIILMTAEPAAEVQAAAWAAGASAIIAKPYTQQRLFGTLASVVGLLGANGEGNAIYSSLLEHEPKPETVSLVRDYIGIVRRTLADPRNAIGCRNAAGARLGCMALKEKGASYGFPM